MNRGTTLRRALLTMAAFSLPLVVPAGAADTEDPCVSLSPTQLGDLATTHNLIVGTTGNDQIIATDLPDVVFAGDGDDVVKGAGGNDVLCGENGHDGLHGGTGDDSLGGGAGNDLLVGADDNDSLWGGNGNDGVHGGLGNDAVAGDAGADDGQTDYLAGGDGNDTMSPRGTDESWQFRQGDTTCPTGLSRHMGAYGSWRSTDPRLDPQGSNPCKRISGEVVSVNAGNDNDGDLHLVVKEYSTAKRWIVEFMPRDFAPLPLLDVGNDVELDGLHVVDGHGNEEIHPVYRVKRLNVGTVYWSGPRHAGSPEKIRPDNVIQCTLCGPRESHRFCWDENGNACTPWATVVPPSGDVEPFKVLTNRLRADVRVRYGYDTETYQ